MTEFLAPGVFIEEIAGGPKPIEGVPTSTAGFVGLTRYGPVRGTPVLVTSFAEFVRRFGDDAELVLAEGRCPNHLAQAVRLFFENGGARLYVARIFSAPEGGSLAGSCAMAPALRVPGADGVLRARHPGCSGNLRVRIGAVRSGNLLAGRRLRGLRAGDVVESSNTGPKDRRVALKGPQAVDPTALWTVSVDSGGRPVLTGVEGALDPDAPELRSVQRITLGIRIMPDAETHAGLSPHPDSAAFIGRVLGSDDDRDSRVVLEVGALPESPAERAAFATALLTALLGASPHRLTGGRDGRMPDGATYAGQGSGPNATGLVAMEALEEVALVAAPGSAALAEPEAAAVRDALIAHAERMRYRFAILAGPQAAIPAAIRAARARHESSRAAIHFPWLVVPQANGPPLALSAEGAIAGLYARNDVERGVHRSPAGQQIRGILGLSRAITAEEQDVLNAEGVNCLRTFAGRGHLLWGARTLSRDPEWKYVNVRRLLIYLEHSLDRGTRWAVFEPNGEALWQRVRQVIGAFLDRLWRDGALEGTRPQDAYLVRCDRTTMTQAELDAGRLVCLVGVAPIKPAEFVLFRIGQWTADTRRD